jgi:hypothetical protein
MVCELQPAVLIFEVIVSESAERLHLQSKCWASGRYSGHFGIGLE